MAPLTWRNVNAPDFSASSDMMNRAVQGFQGAFRQAGDIGRNIHGDKTDAGSRMALQAAQQYATEADWRNALQQGSAYGNVDPRYISAQTLQWGADRGSHLLRDDQIRQNMEIQRQQEARAAQAFARAGSGGGGSGRSGGSGSSDANFQRALLEGQVRIAAASHGINSPEHRAAIAALGQFSIEQQDGTGYLNFADHEVQRETDRADRVSDALASALELVNAGTPTPGQALPRPDQLGNFSNGSFGSAATASAQSSRSGSGPVSDAPTGTDSSPIADLDFVRLGGTRPANNEVGLSFGSDIGSTPLNNAIRYSTLNVPRPQEPENTILPDVPLNRDLGPHQGNLFSEPVVPENRDLGPHQGNLYTEPNVPVNRDLGPRQRQAIPENRDLGPHQGLFSQDQVAPPSLPEAAQAFTQTPLSFGNIGEYESFVNAQRERSELISNAIQNNENLADLKDSDGNYIDLTPEDLGLNPEIANTSEWQKYIEDINDYRTIRASEDFSRSAEEARSEISSPAAINTMATTIRNQFERLRRSNPQTQILDNVNRFSEFQNDNTELVRQVNQQIGVPDAVSLSDILTLASKAGIQPHEAAAAIIAAASPDDFVERNILTGLVFDNTYYNESKAEDFARDYSRAVATPDDLDRINAQSALIRESEDTLTNLYDTYNEATGRLSGIVEALNRVPPGIDYAPVRTQLLQAYNDTYAQALEADKAIIRLRNTLNERATSLGLMTREDVEETTPPDVSDYYFEREDEIAEEFGQYGSTGQAFRTTQNELGVTEAIFDPDFTADSPAGRRHATELLNRVMWENSLENYNNYWNWLSESPEAKATIFEEIRNNPDSYQGIHMPDEIAEEYSSYVDNVLDSNSRAVLESLGFGDLDDDVAMALMQDPAILEAINRFRSTDYFWNFPSTRETNRNTAQTIIRRYLNR